MELLHFTTTALLRFPFSKPSRTITLGLVSSRFWNIWKFVLLISDHFLSFLLFLFVSCCCRSTRCWLVSSVLWDGLLEDTLERRALIIAETESTAFLDVRSLKLITRPVCKQIMFGWRCSSSLTNKKLQVCRHSGVWHQRWSDALSMGVSSGPGGGYCNGWSVLDCSLHYVRRNLWYFGFVYWNVDVFQAPLGRALSIGGFFWSQYADYYEFLFFAVLRKIPLFFYRGYSRRLERRWLSHQLFHQRFQF